MKKIISFFLSLLLLVQLGIGFCSFSASAEAAAPIAEQGTDVEQLITAGYEKSEIPQNATAITKASDFNGMNAGGTYYLAADITLSATYTAKFTGKLYGNGYTVTLSSGKPLFAELDGAEVYDLTIKGTISLFDDYVGALAKKAYNAKICGVTNEASVHNSKQGKFTGGIVGYAENVTLSYCQNKGAITGHSSETRPGGLVGEMNNAEGKLLLEHCINYGAVTGVNQTGGLVARVENGAEAKFSYCANFGTVTVGWSDGGGIIGKVTQSNTKVTFEHCYNSGRINGATNTGGMVSFMNASELTLTDCHNGCFVKNCTCKGSEHGRLTNQKGSHTIGGLVAHMDQRSAIITITDCSNSGHLVAGERGDRNDKNDANISKGYSRVGGIAAVMEGYRVKVENCHNYGKINSDYYIGGLFARAGSSGEATTKDGKTVYSGSTLLLKDCSNSGELTSASYIGGLIGYQEFASGITFTDCRNSGKITAGGNASGILALITESHTEGCAVSLINCANSGKIEGGGTSGGLVAYIAAGVDKIKIKELSLDNCTNTGNVSSPNKVGGLVGDANVNKFIATDCRNEGNINVLNQNEYGCAGGIVGRTYGVSTFTNCTNLGNIIERSALKSGGKAYELVAGGIAGHCGRNGANYKADTAVFKNCVSGAVIVNKKALNNDQPIRAAGIVAISRSTCFADRCVAVGEINATCQAGGIAGDCGSNGQGASDFKDCVVNAPIYNTGTKITSRTQGAAGVACYIWGDAHIFNNIVMSDVTLNISTSERSPEQRIPCSAMVGYTNNGGGEFLNNFFTGKLITAGGEDCIVVMLANTVDVDVSGDEGGDIKDNYSYYQYPLHYWAKNENGTIKGGKYSESMTPVLSEAQIAAGQSFADMLAELDPTLVIVKNCAGIEAPIISGLRGAYNMAMEHAGHAYVENCEKTCFVCGKEKVELVHVYSYECDAKCNVCEEIRENLEHEFGAWTVIKPATETEVGERKTVCQICGAEEVEIIPTKHSSGGNHSSDTDDANTGADQSNGDVKEDEKLPIVMIAAIAGGALLVIVLVVVIVIVSKKKKKNA